MAIFVLAVFMVSIVPAVFAQNIVKRLIPTPEYVEDNATDDIVASESGSGEPSIREQVVERAMISEAVRKGIPILKSVAARRIQEMGKEDFREEKRMILQMAVGKCDQTDDPEACEERLQERVQKVEALGEAALVRLQNFEQRKLNKIAGFNEIQQDEDFKKFKEENAYKARKIAASELKNVKQQYLKIKERYNISKQRFSETKEKFTRAKERVQECTEDESAECQMIREEIRVNAQEHVSNIADVIIEHLNKVRSRIESNEDLTEEEAAEMLDEIEDYIAEIKEAKNTILASESKEEVLQAVNQIKNKWQIMEKRLGVTVGRTVNARVGGIIVKSEQLGIKLERIMERMAENGIDTNGIQVHVDEFDSSIESAKENYKAAMDKFTEAKTKDVPDTAIVREGQQLMKDAHAALKDAQSKLREIVLSINQAGGASELEEDESEEALALVDEEIVAEEVSEE